jgi:hypothetical protein
VWKRAGEAGCVHGSLLRVLGTTSCAPLTPECDPAAVHFVGERCCEFVCRLVLLGDGVAAEAVLREVRYPFPRPSLHMETTTFTTTTTSASLTIALFEFALGHCVPSRPVSLPHPRLLPLTVFHGVLSWRVLCVRQPKNQVFITEELVNITRKMTHVESCTFTFAQYHNPTKQWMYECVTCRQRVCLVCRVCAGVCVSVCECVRVSGCGASFAGKQRVRWEARLMYCALLSLHPSPRPLPPPFRLFCALPPWHHNVSSG